MAVCKYCGKDMLTAKGCKHVPITIGGKTISRLRWVLREIFTLGVATCLAAIVALKLAAIIILVVTVNAAQSVAVS